MLLLLLLVGRWAGEQRWVLADVIDERSEGWVAQQSLDESAVAIILSHESGILAAEVGGFLCFDGDFAFELADVFW